MIKNSKTIIIKTVNNKITYIIHFLFRAYFYYLKGPPFNMSHFELGFFAFGMECAALVYSKEVNLEMTNSLKWVLFNIVSGQITSNAL